MLSENNRKRIGRHTRSHPIVRSSERGEIGLILYCTNVSPYKSGHSLWSE